MSIVPIAGLFEAHLTVTDLARSIAFYQDVVGLELAHRQPHRNAAFFWLGSRGQSMLGLWSIHFSPNRMQLHVAFRVAPDHLFEAIGRLKTAGLTPLGGDGQPIVEPLVIGWMPAASVFFEDPDRHSLELIAPLPGPARPGWGWISLSEWQRRTAR